jgi:hypothetical protein
MLRMSLRGVAPQSRRRDSDPERSPARQRGAGLTTTITTTTNQKTMNKISLHDLPRLLCAYPFVIATQTVPSFWCRRSG